MLEPCDLPLEIVAFLGHFADHLVGIFEVVRGVIGVFGARSCESRDGCKVREGYVLGLWGTSINEIRSHFPMA